MSRTHSLPLWRRRRSRPGPVLPDYRPPPDSHTTGGTAVLPTTARPLVESLPLAGVWREYDPMRPSDTPWRGAHALDPVERSASARPADYATAQSGYVESGVGYPAFDGTHSVVMAAPYTWALPRPAIAAAPPQWAPPSGPPATWRAEAVPSGVIGDLYAGMRPWDASPIVSGAQVPSGSGNQLGSGSSGSGSGTSREGSGCA